MGKENFGPRRCTKCGGYNVSAHNTRYNSFDKYVRRRIFCEDCGERYTTYEVTEEDFEAVKKAKRIINSVRNILQEKDEQKRTIRNG